ncbi:Ubiquitin carboxyl-terminal hydrolase [Mycena venus]|uniref:ubiquitinyl hydrolase 1 n=1 Tax=Mycena venus TaxID=2733690 RepID=A0A8H6XHC2_9AGAR|nr:Ubiquitin carboxyl-terminal hydrolase [Mycena venus]
MANPYQAHAGPSYYMQQPPPQSPANVTPQSYYNPGSPNPNSGPGPGPGPSNNPMQNGYPGAAYNQHQYNAGPGPLGHHPGMGSPRLNGNGRGNGYINAHTHNPQSSRGGHGHGHGHASYTHAHVHAGYRPAPPPYAQPPYPHAHAHPHPLPQHPLPHQMAPQPGPMGKYPQTQPQPQAQGYPPYTVYPPPIPASAWGQPPHQQQQQQPLSPLAKQDIPLASPLEVVSPRFSVATPKAASYYATAGPPPPEQIQNQNQNPPRQQEQEQPQADQNVSPLSASVDAKQGLDSASVSSPPVPSAPAPLPDVDSVPGPGPSHSHSYGTIDTSSSSHLTSTSLSPTAGEPTATGTETELVSERAASPIGSGGWAIWSRRPGNPAHAPGVIISPRARPPPVVMANAKEGRTPPPSPPPPIIEKEREVEAEKERDGEIEVAVVEAEAEKQPTSEPEDSPEPEAEAEVPSSGASTADNTDADADADPMRTPTTAATTMTMPSSPVSLATGKSVPVSPPSGSGSGVAGAPSPPPSASSSSTTTTTAAVGGPQSQKTKFGSLPTSSVVGFSIPAGAEKEKQREKSTSPANRAAVLALLNAPAQPLADTAARSFADASAAAPAASSAVDAAVGKTTTGLEGKLTPRGLVNTGNMCFANAVLQVLVYCAGTASEFPAGPGGGVESGNVSGVAGGDAGTGASGNGVLRAAPLVRATGTFLREFVVAPKAAPGKKPGANGVVGGVAGGKGKGKASPAVEEEEDAEAFIPTYVYDALKGKKRFDGMRGGHQEDAEEFLGFYLDTLEEELLAVVTALSPPSASASSKRTNANVNASAGGSGRAVVEEREEEAPPEAEDGWLEVGKKNRTVVTRTIKTAESPITRIFGGKFRSTLRAPGQKDSVIVEDWRSLRLDIQVRLFILSLLSFSFRTYFPRVPATSLVLPPFLLPLPCNVFIWTDLRGTPQRDGVHTIADALALISQPQTVQMSQPSRPGVVVDASQQVLIDALPPILILHVKRFCYDTAVGGVVKVGKRVAFGPELEVVNDVMVPTARKPQPVKYKLFGVVYHHGISASGGHYTLDVLHSTRFPGTGTNGEREGWVRIDDELVSDVRPADVFDEYGSDSGGGKRGCGVLSLVFPLCNVTALLRRVEGKSSKSTLTRDERQRDRVCRKQEQTVLAVADSALGKNPFKNVQFWVYRDGKWTKRCAFMASFCAYQNLMEQGRKKLCPKKEMHKHDYAVFFASTPRLCGFLVSACGYTLLDVDLDRLHRHCPTTLIRLNANPHHHELFRKTWAGCLLSILSLSDVYTVLYVSQVNRYLRAIALGKQLWISLSARGFIKTSFPNLSQFTTTQFMDQVRRIVVGLQRWRPSDLSPEAQPLLVKEITILLDSPKDPTCLPITHLTPMTAETPLLDNSPIAVVSICESPLQRGTYTISLYVSEETSQGEPAIYDGVPLELRLRLQTFGHRRSRIPARLSIRSAFIVFWMAGMQQGRALL